MVVKEVPADHGSLVGSYNGRINASSAVRDVPSLTIAVLPLKLSISSVRFTAGKGGTSV
jgi:hypothetical protein